MYLKAFLIFNRIFSFLRIRRRHFLHVVRMRAEHDRHRFRMEAVPPEFFGDVVVAVVGVLESKVEFDVV